LTNELSKKKGKQRLKKEIKAKMTNGKKKEIEKKRLK